MHRFPDTSSGVSQVKKSVLSPDSQVGPHTPTILNIIKNQNNQFKPTAGLLIPLVDLKCRLDDAVDISSAENQNQANNENGQK